MYIIKIHSFTLHSFIHSFGRPLACITARTHVLTSTTIGPKPAQLLSSEAFEGPSQMPLLVSQGHLLTQGSQRCLVGSSSATTQSPWGSPTHLCHHPTHPSGIQAASGQNQTFKSCLPLSTPPVCRPILAELSPRASVSLPGRLGSVRDQDWCTTLGHSHPGPQTHV